MHKLMGKILTVQKTRECLWCIQLVSRGQTAILAQGIIASISARILNIKYTRNEYHFITG